MCPHCPALWVVPPKKRGFGMPKGAEWDRRGVLRELGTGFVGWWVLAEIME